MLVFLVIVLNSKHLHIFVAPLNVMFKRQPVALGAVKPLMVEGKPVTLDDIDDLDEDAMLGVGSIEDFSWKGLLDMASCTECGRCQSQCPAWNTEKPLSPKMLIMNLRDHAFAKAPYLLADESARAGLPADVLEEAERPLVGATEGLAWEPEGGAIIDTDVLWSCVTCGACVEQCPVDIEHVDHIVDMRRYQVLVESNFPAELNQLFKGMENKGNPWNMSPTARMDWAKGLDFDVKVVGEDVESLDEVEWLFWVGCAGAYEDRQKKTTRAVAELLHMAGVEFAVLGNGETCNGDQARRAGNEFVFQGLAQQNVETFKEYKVKKVVSTCAHCFNTLKNEYKEFGVELEVVHHTQLLNRLVREGKLTPVKEGAGAHQRKITYHDPCYIGRHNGVYAPPRELLQVLPGAEFVEMERNSEKSFCCGAGGARMWMEENIGERINLNRTNEAVGTGADQIAVGCPFCRVMLSDGLTAAQDGGNAREEVEVLDVAQMLLASVKGEQATKLAPGAAASNGHAPATHEARSTAPTEGRSVETKAEPEQGDVTITEDTVVETSEASPAAKASGAAPRSSTTSPRVPRRSPPAPPVARSSTTSRLRTRSPSVAPTTPCSPTTPRPRRRPRRPRSPAGRCSTWATTRPTTSPPSHAGREDGDGRRRAKRGGSLFDVEEDEPTPAAPRRRRSPHRSPRAARCSTSRRTTSPRRPPPAAKAEPEPVPASEPDPAPIASGGSLFDIEEDDEPTPAPAPAATTEPEPTPEPEPPSPEPTPEPAKAEAEPAADLSYSGSLFDIASPEVADEPAPTQAAEPEPEPEPEPEQASRGRARARAREEAGAPGQGREQRRGEHRPRPTSTSRSRARCSTSERSPRDCHQIRNQERTPSITGACAPRSLPSSSSLC